MNRYLVIGGGGFLGGRVVERLVARGETVRTFGRNHYPELETLNVDQFQGDLRKFEDVNDACEGIDVVIHSAAIPSISCQWKPFYEINTLGTLNVINACLKHAVKKLIYTSSPSVTFDGTEQFGIDETAPYPKTWYSHYPHSKALAEKMVLDTNGRKGLLTCSLRPHLIWGPGDRQLIPRLLERARSGKLCRVGDGTNLVDMIYVDNAAEAHIMAADALESGSSVAGSAYFLTQGKPVNCWDWINEILGFAGLPKVKRSISLKKAMFYGKILEDFYSVFRLEGEPTMTRFLATQLAQTHWFNISKAQRDFGYTPTISTEEGMNRLKEYLAHNFYTAERQ